MHSQSLQFVENQLFDIGILEGIWVVNQTVLILQPLRILSECSFPNVGWIWSYEVYSLWRHTSMNQSSDESYRMRCATVNCNILRSFLPFQQFYVLAVNVKLSVQIWVVNRINTLNECFVFIIWRRC